MARLAIVHYKGDVKPSATRLPDPRPTQHKLRREVST